MSDNQVPLIDTSKIHDDHPKRTALLPTTISTQVPLDSSRMLDSSRVNSSRMFDSSRMNSSRFLSSSRDPKRQMTERQIELSSSDSEDIFSENAKKKKNQRSEG